MNRHSFFLALGTILVLAASVVDRGALGGPYFDLRQF